MPLRTVLPNISCGVLKSEMKTMDCIKKLVDYLLEQEESVVLNISDICHLAFLFFFLVISDIFCINT